MCRLTLLTTTADEKISEPMRRLIFHLAMVYAVADEGQVYGAGVSDGVLVRKSGQPYIERGISWLGDLGAGKVWLGHVRKPSLGTDRTSAKAAHPYEYTNVSVHDDTVAAPFIMAHNGSIDSLLTQAPLSPTHPDTDTFRAGMDLEDQLNGNNITRGQIAEWLSGYDERTSSSYIFLQGGQAIVVCCERPLWVMQIGNGYLINTSRVVLTGVRNTLAQFHGVLFDEPSRMPDYSYARLAPGVHIKKPVALKIKYRPAPSRIVYMRDLRKPSDPETDFKVDGA